MKCKEAIKKGKKIPTGYMLLVGSRQYTIIDKDGREKLISARDIPVKDWLLYVDDWINQENEITKTVLRAIDLRKSFEFRGRMVKAQNVELQPAEIIMGRRNVQALGLREGDSIHDIQERGWRFFYDRIQENYAGVAINSEYYDAVLYDGSYHPVDSNEISFKLAAALAFKEASKIIKPTILEPIMEVKVVVDNDYVGDVMGDMNKRRGQVLGIDPLPNGKQEITATVPEAEIIKYATDLKAMTQASGRFSRSFLRYEEVLLRFAYSFLFIALCGRWNDSE